MNFGFLSNPCFLYNKNILPAQKYLFCGCPRIQNVIYEALNKLRIPPPFDSSLMQMVRAFTSTKQYSLYNTVPDIFLFSPKLEWNSMPVYLEPTTDQILILKMLNGRIATFFQQYSMNANWRKLGQQKYLSKFTQ